VYIPVKKIGKVSGMSFAGNPLYSKVFSSSKEIEYFIQYLRKCPCTDRFEFKFGKSILDTHPSVAKLLSLLFSNELGVSHLSLLELPAMDVHGGWDLIPLIQGNTTIISLKISPRESGTSEDVLANGLEQNTTITSLDLSGGNCMELGELVCTALQMPYLRSLDLSDNNLDAAPLHSILESTCLRQLNVCGCNLGDNPLAAIQLLGSTTLEKLNISNNYLGNPHAYQDVYEMDYDGLYTPLRNRIAVCTIPRVDLSYNSLNCLECMGVIHGFRENTFLRSANIEGNVYNAGFDDAVREAVESNPYATELCVGENIDESTRAWVDSILNPRAMEYDAMVEEQDNPVFVREAIAPTPQNDAEVFSSH
jgi:hypothetical protein